VRVWIVFGSTGEYSDRREWPVRGFIDKARAEAFEFAATRWARDHSKRLKGHECDDCYSAAKNFRQCGEDEKSPHDPDYSRDYTGTDYYTVEVEVES